jgi:hypothetical protein
MRNFANKFCFAPCAKCAALLKTMAQRAAAGGCGLVSNVSTFYGFQNHQPHVVVPWLMNYFNLIRREVFRGKTSGRATQTYLEERTPPAPNP